MLLLELYTYMLFEWMIRLHYGIWYHIGIYFHNNWCALAFDAFSKNICRPMMLLGFPTPIAYTTCRLWQVIMVLYPQHAFSPRTSMPRRLLTFGNESPDFARYSIHCTTPTVKRHLALMWDDNFSNSRSLLHNVADEEIYTDVEIIVYFKFSLRKWLYRWIFSCPRTACQF